MESRVNQVMKVISDQQGELRMVKYQMSQHAI